MSRNSSPKNKDCHLLTLHLFQTFMSLFLLFNTKENILKNVGNQTVDGSHDFFSVSGYH